MTSLHLLFLIFKFKRYQSMYHNKYKKIEVINQVLRIPKGNSRLLLARKPTPGKNNARNIGNTIFILDFK